MAEPISVAGEYRVAKSNDEQQLVFGWASVAVKKDGTPEVDFHDDVIASQDLELAAYDFVLNSRVSGEEHDGGEPDAVLVESVMFTKEKMTQLGIPTGTLPEGWWVGFHIPDPAAYLRAKTSKTMFSIEGTAIREPLNG